MDKLLIHLDVGVPGASYRIGLGFLLVEVLRRVAPGAGLGVATLGLLAALFGLKAATAVARRVVPASATVRAHWHHRRILAGQRDSYQWRKLLWVGLGTLAASLGTAAPAWSLPLGLACVAAGAVAEVFWRRLGLALAPPQA